MNLDLTHAVLMTDPAVAYAPGEGYGPYDRGTDLDLWMKLPNGSASLGLVWPGSSISHFFGCLYRIDVPRRLQGLLSIPVGIYLFIVY